MKFMETWKPNVDTRTIFSRRDILNLRILYANMIYFHNQNNTDTSLVTDFYAAVCVFSLASFFEVLY